MKTRQLQEISLQKGQEETGSKQEILKTLLLAAILTGFLAVVHFSPLKYYFDISNINFLKDKLVSYHSLAPFIFLSSGALVIALGAPRFIVSILGGMVFGFVAGTILSLGAAFAGSIVIFWLTRILGQPFFHQKVGNRLKAVEKHMEENGLLAVILIRQLPVPCMLGNILLGLTSVKNYVFTAGSIIGLFPESAIFSLYGSSVQGSFILKSAIATVLLVLLAWGIRHFYRRSPMAKELARKFRKT